MEAPDKIYLEKIYPDNGVLPNGLNYNQSPNDIEYTRTDAFIEKACSYIRLYSALLDTENNDCMPEWLDKFRNAMKK